VFGEIEVHFRGGEPVVAQHFCAIASGKAEGDPMGRDDQHAALDPLAVGGWPVLFPCNLMTLDTVSPSNAV